MQNHRVIPFYMTYPVPFYVEEETTVMRDLDYLQQMYPADAKKCQKRIAEILDKLDYEGSMIYDEYPDKWMLYQLSRDILAMIKSEEEKANPEKEELPEKWEWLGDMIQVLLFYEIYKRRHTNYRGMIKF